MDKKFENKGKQEEHDDTNDDGLEEMEVDDESGNGDTNGEVIDHSSSADVTHEHHGRRRRVKIRKKIRVKKKTSSKRKYKKLFERIVWTLFIVGFFAALYILFKQLELTDEKAKSGKRRSMILPHYKHNAMLLCNIEKKQNHHISVMMI